MTTSVCAGAGTIYFTFSRYFLMVSDVNLIGPDTPFLVEYVINPHKITISLNWGGGRGTLDRIDLLTNKIYFEK